jgi:Ca2+-binding RTX toxin-like protein
MGTRRSKLRAALMVGALASCVVGEGLIVGTPSAFGGLGATPICRDAGGNLLPYHVDANTARYVIEGTNGDDFTDCHETSGLNLIIEAGGGNDVVSGSNPNGSQGGDTLTGGRGDDTLNGGLRNDEVSGNAGNDSLDGWFGNDTPNGGPGNDVLTAGPDNDSCYGGPGVDN